MLSGYNMLLRLIVCLGLGADAAHLKYMDDGRFYQLINLQVYVASGPAGGGTGL